MNNIYYSHDREGCYDYPCFGEMCKYLLSHIEKISKKPASITQVTKNILRLHIWEDEADFPTRTIKILSYMCRFCEHECHIDDIIINAISTAHDFIDESRSIIKDRIENWNKFCGKGELQVTLEWDFLWIWRIPELLLFEWEGYNIIKKQRNIIIRNTQTFKEITFTWIDAEIFLKLLSKKGGITEYRQVFKFMPSKWLQKDVRQCMDSIDQRISSLWCNISLEEKDWIWYTLHSQAKAKLILVKNAEVGWGHKPPLTDQIPQQITNILDTPSPQEEYTCKKDIADYYPKSILDSNKNIFKKMEIAEGGIGSLVAKLNWEIVTINWDIWDKEIEKPSLKSDETQVIDVVKNHDDPSIEEMIEFSATFIKKYVSNEIIFIKMVKTQEWDICTLHIINKNKEEFFELREEELRIFYILSRFEWQEFSKTHIKTIGWWNCIKIPAIPSRIRRWNERVEKDSFLSPLVIHEWKKKNSYYIWQQEQ